MAQSLRSDRFQRNPSLTQTTVDTDEVVLMNIDTGRFYGVQGASALLWAALGEPRTPLQLCDLLKESFEVREASVEDDVAGFLSELLDAGLVEPAD